MQFLIGLITGGIFGTILMAAAAVSGHDEQCRECREVEAIAKDMESGGDI